MSVNVTLNSVRIGKTEYKYVSAHRWLTGNNSVFYKGKYIYKGKVICKCAGNDKRKVALELDILLIKKGFEPVNILNKCK